jgi:hypothetical protein
MEVRRAKQKRALQAASFLRGHHKRKAPSQGLFEKINYF